MGKKFIHYNNGQKADYYLKKFEEAQDEGNRDDMNVYRKKYFHFRGLVLDKISNKNL